VFRDLQRIAEKPVVFSQATISDLWTDPHVSQQMLQYHLDGSIALSSYTTEFIEASVAWLAETFRLTGGSRVLDLGCGPGLYANRLVLTGAGVTGVDFSSRSIGYAREVAARNRLSTTFVNDDYLAWQTPERFDLIVMIMRDYCALSPDRRLRLLRNVAGWLAPGGSFVFDVDATAALAEVSESASYSAAPHGGFWSAHPYFEFHQRFVYPEDRVSLDKFAVVEADRTRTFYNWIQYFDPSSLADELGRAGLEASSLLGDVTGRPFDAHSAQFAVVARQRRGRRDRTGRD
jgi:SAM-dependent methyltransferase